jgi:hypothetical protein
MAKKSRDIEVFGLSFMDMISCGLGGVIVLMLIFSSLVKGGDSQNDNAGGSETEAQAIARQEQRKICHFYMEVDVISDREMEECKLIYEKQEGVEVDSLFLNTRKKKWKRYVVSYSLPKEKTTGLFPFNIKGGQGNNREARIRIFTDRTSEVRATFASDYLFYVKKVARNYTLKTENG